MKVEGFFCYIILFFYLLLMAKSEKIKPELIGAEITVKGRKFILNGSPESIELCKHYKLDVFVKEEKEVKDK